MVGPLLETYLLFVFVDFCKLECGLRLSLVDVAAHSRQVIVMKSNF